MHFFSAIAFGLVVALAGVSLRASQAVPPQRPPMAEEVFKNIQVLKGIPVDEFMGTMGFFSSSLGLNLPTATSLKAAEAGPATPTTMP